MKNQTRMALLSLVLIAILLLAAVPAAARPKETPFEIVAFICRLGPPVREWYSDGETVLHQRGVVVHSILVSDEPSMNGIAVDVLHQDLNLSTGDGRAWGRGTYETDVGTWQGVWKGHYTGYMITTEAMGQGSHGLEGQTFYWDGQQIPVPEDDPCPDGAQVALFATGAIVDHKGP